MPDATPQLTPPETFHVSDRVAACDGGGGVLGHPRVFLRIPDGATRTTCPYCSRLYVLDAGAGHASGH